MAQDFQLTTQQQQAFYQIRQFLEEPKQAFFILKGYAGTGKTSLLQHLAKHLDKSETQFALLAPTGRAAAVLSAKTGYTAKTLHSELYHFKDIDGDAPPEKEKTNVDDYGQMRLLFEIRKPDEASEKVYIVDEASMIGDERNDESSFASFGTGHLLTDFLTLVGENKVIFAGDPCQLPPVGSLESPALMEGFFRKLGKMVFSYEMTQILRQKQDSEVLKLATQIRRMTSTPFKTKWVKIPARNGQWIQLAGFDRMKELYITDLLTNGSDQTIAISLSNKNCHQINLEVRNRLYGNAYKPLQKGDLLMVTQNNYLVPLTNGDFVEVIEVGHEENVKGISFIHVTVRARLSGKSHETLLCLEPLHNGSTNLSLDQQRLLMIDFSQRMRYKKIRPKTEAYYAAMQKDHILNSLRANFGYAVTCHKSQGGEWEKVYFFLNKGMYVMNPPELTRWWYTGITRSKERLILAQDWWIG
ncbi:ATP-dependent RecD-like DNA helicase [Belliella kenyensis]|uniref:ATP-dependent RecD-like DNA helicase n=1 Tax=Belliella kenyensis TaxID=1472724 RepID=A0ABV8ET17_9BACT|nr:AAA family ATPase [Belliella kenyensis]MCH7402130.1 AAA family ATPase [Belliella kenyensis]MDN3601645.1 AAA family ATPase [Belliella kenyensis]